MKHINASYINPGVIDNETKWKWGEYKQFHMIGYINQSSLIILNADNLRVFQELVFTTPPLSFAFSRLGTLAVSTETQITIYHCEDTRTLFQPPQYVEYSKKVTNVDSIDFLSVPNDENNEFFVSTGVFIQVFEIKKREPTLIFSMPIVRQTQISACIDGEHFSTWSDNNLVKVWKYHAVARKVLVQYIKANGKIVSVTWRKNWTKDAPAMLLITDSVMTTLWYDNPSSTQSATFSLFCSTGMSIPKKDGLVSWMYYHHNLHNPYFPSAKANDTVKVVGFHSSTGCQRLLPKIDIPRKFSPDYLVQFDGKKIVFHVIEFTPNGTPILDQNDPVNVLASYNNVFNFKDTNAFIPMCTEALRGNAQPTQVSLCCRSEGRSALFSLKKVDNDLPKEFVEPQPLIVAGHTAEPHTIVVHQTQQYFVSISKKEAILWLIGGVQQYLGAYLKLVGVLELMKNYCFCDTYVVGCEKKKAVVYRLNKANCPELIGTTNLPYEATCVCSVGDKIAIGTEQGVLLYSIDTSMQLKGSIKVRGVIRMSTDQVDALYIGTEEANYVSKITRLAVLPLSLKGKIYSHQELRVCVVDNNKVSVYQKEASDVFELECNLGDASEDLVLMSGQRSGYISIAIGRGNVLEWWTPTTCSNIRVYNTGYEKLDSILFSDKIGALGTTKEGTSVIATGKKIFVFSKWEQNIQRVTKCIEPQQSYQLFHPRCLLQMIFAGCMKQTKVVLVVYLKTLKENKNFPLVYNDVYKIYHSMQLDSNQTNEYIAELITVLQQTQVKTLSTSEQGCVAGICEAIIQANQMEGLDECGINFYVAWKLDTSIGKFYGKLITPFDAVWAFHSEAIPLLCRELSGTKMNLEEALNVGVEFWLMNKPELLKNFLSDVAKVEFLKKKDPGDVAIIYVLLGRVPALAALYRMNQEMKIADFLVRDFSVDRNRIAAVKNGFVLTSQHKYSIAIAFFFLGEAIQEAVNVALDKLNNVGLAFLIVLFSKNVEKYMSELLLVEMKKRKEIFGELFCYLNLKRYSESNATLMKLTEEPNLLYFMEYLKNNTLLRQLYKVNEIEQSSFGMMRRNVHLYLRNRCAPLAFQLIDAQIEKTVTPEKTPSPAPPKNDDDWFDDLMSDTPAIVEKKKETSLDQCFPVLSCEFDVSVMKDLAKITAEHLMHRYIIVSKTGHAFTKNFVAPRIVPFLDQFGVEKETTMNMFYDICTLTDSIDLLCRASCESEAQDIPVAYKIQDTPFVSSFVDQGISVFSNSSRRGTDEDVRVSMSKHINAIKEGKLNVIKKSPPVPPKPASKTQSMSNCSCLGMQFINKAEEPLYAYLISRVFPPVHSLNALTHLYEEAHRIFLTHVEKKLVIPRQFLSMMIVLIFVVSGRRKNYDLILKLVTTPNRTVEGVCQILKEKIEEEEYVEKEMSDSEQFLTGLLILFTIPLISELLHDIDCEKIDSTLTKWTASLITYTSYLTPRTVLEIAPTEFSFRIFSKEIINFLEKECKGFESMLRLYTLVKETRADVLRSVLSKIFDSASIPTSINEVEPQINVPSSKNTLMIDTPPVNTFCCSADNNFVIYSTKDCIKRLAKVETSNDLRYCYYAMHPTTHKPARVVNFSVKCMDSNPKFPYFVVGTEDGLILIFKYSQDEAIIITAIHNNISPSLSGNGPKGYGIKNVRWNSVGTKLIACDMAGYVAVYRFTVNDITLVMSEKMFDQAVDAIFIGETMFFAAAGNREFPKKRGELVIGNLLQATPVVTRSLFEPINAICLVERYSSVLVSDEIGIKFVDIQTGRICSEKPFEKGVSAIAVDTYSICLFAGLSDGRIIMSHLPDLGEVDEIGRHQTKPRGGNLFKSMALSRYYSVNKLEILWFDKNAQPELYSCSNDGSLIQRSIIYFQ
ncbi:hypothetical protein EIN_251990 [Entamoeba invadens IP1]|uniref:RAVE complex protein Rav1 C-terminal domain-containing protein n=1 Tax=Entamoeba invadens IP1 TaxID=370355 RepID=A0A0A1UEJ8_ENTIV|nr:hypothetical protein EIN_251990 [Entamoeba invadens IP1]ELP95005.1 hypothetical protein EIN_251990 [Entamoeba invadens IP1]|eukprot:XP_004261776.1 hypothetical protein EIN_251990 [Entamoeba invadens IP1]